MVGREILDILHCLPGLDYQTVIQIELDQHTMGWVESLSVTHDGQGMNTERDPETF